MSKRIPFYIYKNNDVYFAAPMPDIALGMGVSKMAMRKEKNVIERILDEMPATYSPRDIINMGNDFAKKWREAFFPPLPPDGEWVSLREWVESRDPTIPRHELDLGGGIGRTVLILEITPGRYGFEYKLTPARVSGNNEIYPADSVEGDDPQFLVENFCRALRNKKTKIPFGVSDKDIVRIGWRIFKENILRCKCE